METHAHLGDDHADQVRMFRDETKTGTGSSSRSTARSATRASSASPTRAAAKPGFLEEFRREIALVAFDLLLYHLQASHAERVGLPPIPANSRAAGGTT